MSDEGGSVDVCNETYTLDSAWVETWLNYELIGMNHVGNVFGYQKDLSMTLMLAINYDVKSQSLWDVPQGQQNSIPAILEDHVEICRSDAKICFTVMWTDDKGRI